MHGPQDILQLCSPSLSTFIVNSPSNTPYTAFTTIRPLHDISLDICFCATGEIRFWAAFADVSCRLMASECFCLSKRVCKQAAQKMSEIFSKYSIDRYVRNELQWKTYHQISIFPQNGEFFFFFFITFDMHKDHLSHGQASGFSTVDTFPYQSSTHNSIAYNTRMPYILME